MPVPQMGLPDFLGSFNENRQIGERRGLAQLMQGAMQAPREQRPELLAKMAGTSPEFAAGAQKHFDANDETARNKLGQYAMAFDALPDEQKAQAYPQLAQQAQALGIPAPMEWNPAFAPNIQKLAMALSGGKGGAMPAGFQELHMKALAAGLQPGSPEYQQAMNIALGREGRAATGGFGFEVVKGADGRERMGRTNPRTGAFEVLDEGSNTFAPLGGTAPLNGGPSMAPQGGDFAGSVASIVQPLGGRITSTTGGQHNPGSLHPSGGAVDIGMGQESPEQQAQMIAALEAQGFKVRDERTRPPGQAVWSGPHLHVERGQMAQGGSPALGVSRRPEDEAAAKTNAEESVKLGYLPRTEAIKADAAVQQAVGIARGQAGVEVDTKAATKLRDAQATLGLLAEAERLLPNATGSFAGALVDDVAGGVGYATKGAEATSQLKLIAAELVAKVPRFEGPQSNIDVQFYREAAGDLANDKIPVARRLAALKTMRRLREKALGQHRDAPRSNSVAPSSQFTGFRVLED